MNDILIYLIVFLIIVVYIFIGVFASLWMDKYYFDAKSPNLRKLGNAFDNDCPYDGRDFYVHFTDPAQCKVEIDEGLGWPAYSYDRLHVPKGCREIFAKAEQWRDFETIDEFE